MSHSEEPRRGKDFVLGFVPALLLAVLGVCLAIGLKTLTPLIGIGAVLACPMILALVKQRPFIALGILTILVGAPLLLVGSCFALFAFQS
jgi:hypothetical protein